MTTATPDSSTTANIIPYGRQTITEDDVAAVVSALRGDYLTTGPTVAAFERAIADAVEAEHAVAFCNGTATLHGACYAGGLSADSLVSTSSLSFAASASCAKYVGASVDFIDIDPATLNLDPTKVNEASDGLVAVHFAGLPVALTKLAYRPSVVIEDAAHALGASTPDGPVGNCAHSDMTSFSFHPVKPITTGEGGIVTTNNDELAERLRRFRSHGVVRDPSQGGWYQHVEEIGYNYRLTDVQSALGLSQLRKLDEFIGRRQELAGRYDTMLAGSEVVTAPQAAAGWRHGYHIYPVRVPDRRRVYEALHAERILVQVHYVPIHHHPPYRDPAHELPNTDQAYEGLLSLPIFPTLTFDEQDRVVEALLRIVGDTANG